MGRDVISHLGGDRGEGVRADQTRLRVKHAGSGYPVDVAALHRDFNVHHAIGADGEASGRQIDLVGPRVVPEEQEKKGTAEQRQSGRTPKADTSDHEVLPTSATSLLRWAASAP